jgi:hypothetical protein
VSERLSSERCIEFLYFPSLSQFNVQPVTIDGRAVLHLATRSLLSRNDLVWHYLVLGATRVLDRVSELLSTLGVEP